MGNIYTQNIKLDFKDVLIRPKPSTLESRSQVSLVSNILKDRLGIETNGIIAANMDGVGTIEVAQVLKKHGANSKFCYINKISNISNADKIQPSFFH